MHLNTLASLRCPFCGTRLTMVDSSPVTRSGEDVISAVLGCECCAYPVVAGIPVIIADETTRTAMHQMEAGSSDAALLTLLGLEGDRARSFERLIADPGQMTFRSALEVLSPDPEGTYFLYRFSDPTYVMAQSILQAIGQHTPMLEGRAIDLCGGSGHLTRVLIDQGRGREVTLADLFFWKLWLAKTFTAPECTAVCCDANSPLPFERHTFRLVVLSDAFPYIWHKRLLADEMQRLVTIDGAIVMPHLHSSLGENFSAGMTMTPASYRDLFLPMSPRLFLDRSLLDDVLDGSVVDLTASVSADGVGDAPSLTLIATADERLFRRFTLEPPGTVTGELRVNPLYTVSSAGEQSVLRLQFPSDEYEEEFADCKRYLPDSVTVSGDLSDGVELARLGPDAERLRRRRVIIDAPLRYY
jgi:uncharacterized protein YbaR (Trm112 family)